MFLAEKRKEIDIIDNEIWALLKKRLDISKEIAGYKEQNLIPITDNKRENEITLNAGKILGDEYARELYKVIFSFGKKKES